MDIKNEIKKGNKRAVARLISMIENNDPEAVKILKELWRYSQNTRIIGITGPPGSGKSTLTDCLAKLALKNGRKVGIIAVDPSSPITGGALLGDRVRMTDLNREKDVFIRSMGTRGALGGISKAVYGAVRALETFGMEYIFIETVGVGQSEIDIVGIADTVVMVAVPGLGDDVRAGKAGILEVIDVIAVNKADHVDADRTVHSLRYMIGLNAEQVEDTSKHHAHLGSELDSGKNGEKTGEKTEEKNSEKEKGHRVPEIIKTIATKNEGTAELMDAIERHYQRICSNGEINDMHNRRLSAELRGLALAKLSDLFVSYNKCVNALENGVKDIMNAKCEPYSIVDDLIREFINAEVKNVKKG